MRTRNGADFIEPTIRSHIDHYDEIVVVYNQCEDKTPDILRRLAQEFSPKLRIIHYIDRVEPLGSQGHRKTDWDSPASMVNYSNFALAQTRHQIAVKLDDDHLAIPERVSALCQNLRSGKANLDVVHCFSALNLTRGASGTLGIPAFEPAVGSGHHGYFRVMPSTYFRHDNRFERMTYGSLKRRFAGVFYWHLKYLKKGAGFRNYELADNPDSRFARKKTRFEESPLITLAEAKVALKPGPLDWLKASLFEKSRLTYDRDCAIQESFEDETVEQALDRLNPGWQRLISFS